VNTESTHAFSAGDGSRSDDVRSDPPRTLLNGNYTREGINPSFSRGDVGLVGSPYKMSLVPSAGSEGVSFTSVMKGGADMEIRAV
jgi:hypothetical protein